MGGEQLGCASIDKVRPSSRSISQHAVRILDSQYVTFLMQIHQIFGAAGSSTTRPLPAHANRSVDIVSCAGCGAIDVPWEA